MPKIQLVEPVGVLSSPTIDHWNHPHTGGEHNHHQFYELIQQWNRHVLYCYDSFLSLRTTKQSADENNLMYLGFCRFCFLQQDFSDHGFRKRALLCSSLW